MNASSSAQKPSPGEGPFHIPSLDGIRAISFLIVFLGHGGLEKLVPGYFGLSLFFFLSGYLITTLLRLEYQQASQISLKQFYLRRVLRIFPPFYLVLAVASLLTLLGVTGGTLWPSALAAQALHVTNYWIVAHGWWDGMAPGTWVYWSLAVEEHFYLVFPLLFAWLQRAGFTRARQAKALLGLCAVVLLWRCVLIFLLGADKDRTYVASDTRVDSIIAGCILAVWNNPMLDRAAIDERRLGRVWLPLGLCCVLVSLALGAVLAKLGAERVAFQFDQTLRYSLQSFGLMPFFAAAILWPLRWPFSWLNLRPVRYLGTLSYSMYLMHTFALWMFEHWLPWPTPLRTALAFAALVGLGALIYRYVEKPCARLRRKLSGYLEPVKPAALSPVAEPSRTT